MIAAAHEGLVGATGAATIATPLAARAVAGVLACAALAAVIGIIRRDNSIADVFWGLLLAAGTLAAAAGVPSLGPYHLGIVAMVLVWGGRLALHLGARKLREPAEDRRYAAWRAGWGPRTWVVASLAKVYLLQAALATVIMTPVVVVLSSAGPVRPSLVALGVALFAAGLAIEAIADRQLRQFKERRRAGRETASLCTDGLWSRSRHPNYFGEATLWLGISVYAAAAPRGWIGLVGALTVFVLVRYVSGVPLLERAWRERSGYAQWAQATPVFFPRLRAGSGASDDRWRPRMLPPMWLAVAAAAAWLVDRSTSAVVQLSQPEATVAGALLIAAGAGLALWGERQFAAQGTGVIPGSEITAFVRSGPYRFTRNPMYLGMTIALVGVCVALGSWPALAVVPAFMLVIHQRFIRREEAMLRARFGAEQWRDYERSVRRWI